MTAPVRVYLVRHARAAASFGEALDPGLDATGLAQAEAMARRLGPLGPLPLVTSPMRRARETAAPLERLWRRQARVEPRVSEIPAPVPLTRRPAWLAEVRRRRWPEVADPALHAWRAGVIAALAALPEPTVVVSHYIPISVAVGWATGDDRVECAAPDHASVTVLEVAEGGARLVERGREGTGAAL